MKHTTTISLVFQDKRWKLIDAKMRRFAHQPHALIEVLYAVQEAFGFLGEDALRFVASSLHVPLSKVYGVATFYNFFRLKPRGEHTCILCMGTACYVKGANQLAKAIQEQAGIKAGETTPDGRVSLLTVRCIGACSLAPAVIYDGQVAGRQTPDDVLEKIKSMEALEVANQAPIASPVRTTSPARTASPARTSDG